MNTKFYEMFSILYNDQTLEKFSNGFSENELNDFADFHTKEKLLNLLNLFPPPHLYEIYQVYKKMSKQ